MKPNIENHLAPQTRRPTRRVRDLVRALLRVSPAALAATAPAYAQEAPQSSSAVFPGGLPRLDQNVFIQRGAENLRRDGYFVWEHPGGEPFAGNHDEAVARASGVLTRFVEAGVIPFEVADLLRAEISASNWQQDSEHTINRGEYLPAMMGGDGALHLNTVYLPEELTGSAFPRTDDAHAELTTRYVSAMHGGKEYILLDPIICDNLSLDIHNPLPPPESPNQCLRLEVIPPRGRVVSDAAVRAHVLVLNWGRDDGRGGTEYVSVPGDCADLSKLQMNCEGGTCQQVLNEAVQNSPAFQRKISQHPGESLQMLYLDDARIQEEGGRYFVTLPLTEGQQHDDLVAGICLRGPDDDRDQRDDWKSSVVAVYDMRSRGDGTGSLTDVLTPGENITIFNERGRQLD